MDAGWTADTPSLGGLGLLSTEDAKQGPKSLLVKPRNALCPSASMARAVLSTPKLMPSAFVHVAGAVKMLCKQPW